MSYDVKKDTITVNDETYHVERTEDRGGWGGTTLTLRTFDVEQDEFVPAFEGLEGTLGYEESGEGYSPREWSNVGTMAVSYRGYNLGDEDIEKMDFEIECPDCEGSGETEDMWRIRVMDRDTETIPRNPIETFESEEEANEYADQMVKDRIASLDNIIIDQGCTKCNTEGYIELNPAEYFIRKEGARVVIGLFVYEHSGITMRAGSRVGERIKKDDIRSSGRFIGDDAGWDTSFVGFIYDTPEKLSETSDNWTDEQIEKALRSEVEVYASYLEGDLTYYNVQDEETGFMEGCGGYVGSADECQDECFAAMEQAIIKRLAEQQERAEMAARDIITN